MALKQRDRRALLLLGVVVVGFLAYAYGIEPLIRRQRHVREEIARQQEQLRTYQRIVARRKGLTLYRQSLTAALQQLDAIIYTGDKAPLTAAEVQQVLKELARRAGVKIEREKILDPVEAGSFLRIPVEINARTSIRNLSQLIYLIEAYAKFLAIPELSIEVANRQNPSTIRARFVVTALLREPKKPTGAAPKGS
ncbi:MAG: type II secretion system protein M [Candidatus Tectomicrobia bacterium]|nr:type II secretion system protein M [Candidatus Tectomicrobia bacterium]